LPTLRTVLDVDLRLALAAASTNWGDVPSWINSIATILALLFAALAVVAGQRVYRIESERDRVAAEAREQQAAFLRRTQAALVSAWWGWQPADPGGQRAGRWGAFVRNASETPVYQASLTMLDIHDPDVSERFDLAIVPPGTEPVFYPSGLNGASGDGDRPAGAGWPVQDGQHAVDYRVEVAFTDSTGVRWIRDQQGRLSELRPEVLIWADERRAAALRRHAADFLTAHGVKLRFRTDRIETLRQELISPAGPDEMPDAVVGPHDWIGDLVRHGVIEPLALSHRRRAGFVPMAVEAMTYQNELYGVPYALDSAVLLRNTDLVPEAPTTFEEMLSDGERLRAAGRADETFVMQVGPDGDPYYMYPVLVAAGGWLFGRDHEGRLDTGVTGLHTPETLAAFERFRGLGAQGAGALRRDIDRERATDLFAAGRTPYLICASRVVSDARRAKLPFAVGPVPPFAGLPAVRPFVSVHGFFLTRRGRNKTIAQDLAAHYLTRTDVSLALYETQPRPPALRAALDQILERDPVMAAFYRECQAGDLMPSMPQMSDVWHLLARAEVELVTGAPAEPVVRRLADAVRSVLPSAQPSALPDSDPGQRTPAANG
jgi:arabinogalactan oligomer / maltooligosaccharide transport system substrate-binding protein